MFTIENNNNKMYLFFHVTMAKRDLCLVLCVLMLSVIDVKSEKPNSYHVILDSTEQLRTAARLCNVI